MSEARPGEERQGISYALLMWSSSILMISGGFALLILMLATVIGPFNFMGIDYTAGSRALGLWHMQVPNEAIGIETRRRREAWMEMLPDDLRVLHAYSLSELLKLGVPAIGIPDSRRITLDESQQLMRYVNNGGALVLTGSVGVREPDYSWRGYQVMREMLGTDWVRPLERGDSSFIAASRRGPLTAGLTPGARLRLAAEKGVPAIQDPLAELRWREPGRVTEIVGPAASRRRELGDGRLVWLALGPENTLPDVDIDRRRMERVLQSSIAWAMHEAMVEVLPWPDGAPFAATIVTDRSEEAAARARRGVAAVREELFEDLGVADLTANHLLLRIPVEHLQAREVAELTDLADLMLQAQEAWVAPVDEVDAWRLRHEKIAVAKSRVGPNRVRIDVSNLNDESVEGAALRLYFNRPVEVATVASTAVGQESAGLRFRTGAETADIVLPPLPGGASRSYFVDYGKRELFAGR